MTILKDLDKLLRANAKKFHVPGASIAILRNGRIAATAAAGVVNLDTRVKTTEDSLFQIGSITKPLTATLVMQLVDEGLVSLDDAVVKYLPEFRVAQYAVSQQVTVRQLLSHTSGIDGDFFADAGRGDDAIQRLVDKSVLVPSLFQPGEMMSYCNLGYAVLGRILEVIRRKSYDEILQEYLFNPLALTRAFSRPEDAIRYSCAIGHIQSNRNPDTWHTARTPYLAFGQKPAGATPSMSASDLLQFAHMHLKHGKNKQGIQVLKSASVKAMQKRQVKLLPYSPNAIQGCGLGWFLMNWHGEKVFGHDGATIGQFAFLRILPAKNIAVALLTNGGDTKGLYRAMFSEVFGALAKTTEPVLPAPVSRQPSLDSYVGNYSNMQIKIKISRNNEQLIVDMVQKDSQASQYPDNTTLTFIAKNTAQLVSGNPVVDRTTVHFSCKNAQDNPEYLQIGFRQYRREE